MSLRDQVIASDAPKPPVALERYDAACRAIAEAVAVDEVKGIRDQAMAMAAAAKIARNHQAEADMTALRFRAERQLGLMMEAQRASTGLAPAGRPKIGIPENPISKPITLAEAGIDKNLANRARKYAAVPEAEFNARIDEYRQRVSEEGERAVSSLLKAGERVEQERRENDFYPTPESVIAEIISRWRPTTKLAWEPCQGDGRVAAALRAAGYEVVVGDIATGEDFFACSAPPRPGMLLCTNPPFDRLREFIDHAFAIGIREMCLVLPERVWASGVGREQFERHRPSVWVNLDWREDYLGKGGSPDRALAVAIWNEPCAAACIYEVWTRGVEATESSAETLSDAATVRPAPLVDPAMDSAEAGGSGQPESIPALTEQFLGANVSGLERAGVTAGETALHSNPRPSSSREADRPASAPVTVPANPSKADMIRKLRPHCRHADNTDLCGGMGKKHCRECQAAAESEAA